MKMTPATEKKEEERTLAMGNEGRGIPALFGHPENILKEM